MVGLPGFASQCLRHPTLTLLGNCKRDKTLLYTYAFWGKKVFWSGMLKGCETAGSVLMMKILLRTDVLFASWGACAKMFNGCIKFDAFTNSKMRDGFIVSTFCTMDSLMQAI